MKRLLVVRNRDAQIPIANTPMQAAFPGQSFKFYQYKGCADVPDVARQLDMQVSFVL